ncbi:MAG: biopolymer transporter ExbD [Verrucomicrobiota bacterium]
MKAERRPQDEAGFQLAPMIDMTFLLLIFFMVTTKITKEKVKIDINLPIASAALSPDDLSGRDVINVDDAGIIYIGDNSTDLPTLKAYLKQRLIDYPPLRIYIRADAKTPASQIKKIMKACADAGAVEVIFGSYKK